MKHIHILLTGLLMTSAALNAMQIVTIEQNKYQQVLKTPAQAVQFPLHQEDIDLIAAMKEKLYQLSGVGLAAPQVNVAKQIVAIYIPEDAALLREHVKPYPMHILINPHYEALPQSTTAVDFEACYSVASKAGKVPRFEQIKVSYYDEAGQYHQQIEKGFYARVLQHEIDHLNGLLIIDRLTPDCVQGSMEEMMALRRLELPEEKKALFDSLMTKKNKKIN